MQALMAAWHILAYPAHVRHFTGAATAATLGVQVDAWLECSVGSLMHLLPLQLQRALQLTLVNSLQQHQSSQMLVDASAGLSTLGVPHSAPHLMQVTITPSCSCIMCIDPPAVCASSGSIPSKRAGCVTYVLAVLLPEGRTDADQPCLTTDLQCSKCYDAVI